MYNKRKTEEFKRRSEELRSRALSAPRLKMAVPSLAALRIVVHEHSEMSCTTYRKLVVIGSAPALFVISCGDERCEDGGHDITPVIMQALNARAKHGEGVHQCDGTTGMATCNRRIRFELIAEYDTAN